MICTLIETSPNVWEAMHLQFLHPRTTLVSMAMHTCKRNNLTFTQFAQTAIGREPVVAMLQLYIQKWSDSRQFFLLRLLISLLESYTPSRNYTLSRKKKEFK